ncbi:helix-turn-helix transcriptional regulator [Saliphagus infecundisoli]|uniref:Helix-turn-helix transcriptional regulator n=1 Tax=Saliphagus infecundisoli TaxID=1849069 RepID=A0ABD5QFU6_9EURY|nr:hypothetical protein [Saliphagus infecundisoli]
MDTEILSVVLQRWEVVDSLREEPKDKRALVGDVDCSRSTVDRAVRELESIGVVEYREGDHGVTPLGETVASGLEALVETVERRIELEPFLEWIPEGEFDLGLEHLSGAELWVPEPGDPWAMVNRHVAALEAADDVRCVLPLTGLHAYEAVYEGVVAGGRAELIVSPDVARTFRTDPAYADMTAELATTGRYRLSRYDGSIPYFVGLLDDIVQIGVDEAGEPRALLETTDPEARRWAEGEIEAYERDGTRVDLSVDLPADPSTDSPRTGS